MVNAFILSLVLGVPADAPRFVAESSAEGSTSGVLERLTPDFSATMRTNTGRTTIAGVVSLRRSDRVIPGLPTGPHVITTTGDRIPGTAVGGDGRFFRFRPTGIALDPDSAWKFPLSSVAVLWLTSVPADTPIQTSRYDWMNEVRNQDVLQFRNGDTARGTLDGFEPDAEMPTLSFRLARGEKRSIAAMELAAIGFNPALARARKPKGIHAQVVLGDGSRIALTNPAVADGVLSGLSLFGEKVQVRLTEVVAIDAVAGKAAYLSDLNPKKVEQTGFLGVTWSWSKNQAVRGDSLRAATALGQTTADKGIGTHPRTTLTYDLGGKYQRFEALVGLDPAAPVRSGVAVRVLVDGKEQAVRGLRALSVGNAVPVRVELRGSKELVLVTDFGSAGGVGGDVNWLDARLVE